MANSEVVVFGGSGFIGRTLVQMLLERGCAVTVVSRQSFESADPRLRYARGSVADRESVDRAVQGARVVFHLATGGGPAWADFERDFLEGGRAIAEACLRHGVARLVYTSSIAALYLGGGRTVDESRGLDPKPHRRGVYARAKILAENLLSGIRKETGLPLVILRPGIVMGPGGLLNHSGIGAWASDLWCLGWGKGKRPLPFVLVTDVAAALWAAMETPKIEGTTFNLAGDVYLTAAECVAAMAHRSRRDIRFCPQALWKLQSVEIAKWMLKKLAGKPDAAFPSFRDLKSRSLRAPLDCSAAKQILGWRPNADPDVFLREAIDPHIKPIPPGDLRHVPAGRA